MGSAVRRFSGSPDRLPEGPDGSSARGPCAGALRGGRGTVTVASHGDGASSDKSVWQTPGMPQNSGDDRTEPTLELPSLKMPGLGRRRKKQTEPTPEETVQPPSVTEVQDSAPEEAEGPPAPEDPEPARPVAEDLDSPAPAPAPRRAARKDRSSSPARSLVKAKRPTGPVAAALAGALVGLAGGAGTYAALAGCEAVRGVSTCGGAPGFFILLAIVVLMVLLGTALLKALAVKDPGSTSFLAVGIVAVASMLFLLDVMDSPWMFVVVPALSAGAYLLAHWVTSRYADEPTGRQDWM